MFLPPPTSQQTTEKSTINLWKNLTLSTFRTNEVQSIEETNSKESSTLLLSIALSTRATVHGALKEDMIRDCIIVGIRDMALSDQIPT